MRFEFFISFFAAAAAAMLNLLFELSRMEYLKAFL
jgi:hypothetical protein